MLHFSVENNKLIFRYDAETMWIEPWGRDALRVRATKCAEMPEESWALTEPVSSQADIRINDDEGAEIINGRIKACVSPFGKITYYNDKGKLLLEEYVRDTRSLTASTCSPLQIEAREFRPILGGDYSLSVRFDSTSPDEKIYGMGQYQYPCLDLKGSDLELMQRNSQVTVPFCVSSEGYGMLWNNPALGRATFGKNLTTWQAYSTRYMDYWITAGDTPAEIVEKYADVTGKPPMMPDFAMGFWQCKLRYQTQEELLEVAREYKRRGLPLSAIVIDFFHWPQQGDWRFDAQYWPDPDAMIKELKEMGIEVMVSVWPTVDSQSENYEEMLEKGYLMRTDRGMRHLLDCNGPAVHFDATNPEARKFVWEKVKKNYYDKGIRSFWLDVAEPECNPYDYDICRYRMGSAMQVGNIYPLMYSKGFYQGMEAQGQENILNLVRSAWAGSQKYGTLVWSGDVLSSFDVMRIQLAAGLNMGMAGIPWWTTDIGGFHGGDVRDPKFHELLVRWFEFGAFSPVMRLHGNRMPAQPPMGTTGGAACCSGAANEVWSFTPEMLEIFTKYIFIREKLRPYTKKIMEEAHIKGSPVMRTLFYQFPEDREAWNVEDQYMYGGDILVAPVMYEGRTEREVYLPAGEKWRNIWNGQVYGGGQRINVSAPLDEIPVFVRDSLDLDLLEEK